MANVQCPTLSFGIMTVVNGQSLAGEIKTSSIFVSGDTDKPEQAGGDGGKSRLLRVTRG